MRCDHSTFVQGARHNQLRFRHLFKMTARVLRSHWLTECNIDTNLGGRDDYVDRKDTDSSDFVIWKLLVNERKKNLKKKKQNAEA